MGVRNLTNLKWLDLSNNEFNSSLTSSASLAARDITEEARGSLEVVEAVKIAGEVVEAVGNRSLRNLKSLKKLYMRDNGINSSLTLTGICELKNLAILDLSFNSFYDQHLKCLHNLSNLKGLDLSTNWLSGKYLSYVADDLTSLEYLSLSNNNLESSLAYDLFQPTSQLPENIGTILPRLLYVDMSKNLLEGSIPSSMGGMRRLHLLDLSSNNFSGELPNGFLNGCFSLKFLKLSNNKFQGQIFPRHMNLTQLQWLYLDNNNFSGKIGNGLLNATSLVVLDISNNKVSGQIPHWIGKFSIISHLVMSNNLLEGSLPIELSNLKSLSLLDVSKNRLSGSIVHDFTLSVDYLYMQKNALNGSIPKSLFENSNLITLDLRGNKFFGNIDSHWFNDRSTLHVLLLSGNDLQGNIPNQLCQLRKLGLLDLSRNKLNGSIPPCFINLTCWSVVGKIVHTLLNWAYSWDFAIDRLDFSYDRLGSSFFMDESFDEILHAQITLKVEFTMKNRLESYEGYIFGHISGLDLSDNELTGEIPSKIGELQGILALNLSYNSLSGPIPKSFAHLKEIESLDLSHNKLSGQIPLQLTQLYNLEVFYVANNNLSGSIPNQAQFGSFNESSYEGNPYLCGQLIKKSCTNATMPQPPTTMKDEDDNESVIDMEAFGWSFVGSYVTTILVLIVILWINSYWRRHWFNFIDVHLYLCFYWFSKYIWH
ncbi:receptor-like protein 15 [Mangifera indica]|uniref:receptor-like protein 15 n=1 Tax=Mangifera indica TaxID=29780 RepID=UPI001CFC15C6|nr:receptor-like protein 15 [Mangifera indica]